MSLVRGRDGNFYGTTEDGGFNNEGTVFKITPAGKLTTLWNFCSYASCSDGIHPDAGLLPVANGGFYGAHQLERDKRREDGLQDNSWREVDDALQFLLQTNCSDGMDPDASLVQGADGNFYSTTRAGGTNGASTIFKISLKAS